MYLDLAGSSQEYVECLHEAMRKSNARGDNKGVVRITALKKVAIFLMIIGVEKGQSIIALMDNGEINAVIPEIRRLTEVSRDVRESVWAEFKELGYEDKMKPSEALTIIRFLFNGSKIGDKS